MKRIPFGSYTIVYTKTTNIMKARSVPAVALNPSNQSRGYYFMSLYSGRRIHAYDWDEVPINRDMIDRVDELAIAEKQPKLVDGLPIFKWNASHIPLDDVNVSDTDVEQEEHADEIDMDDVQEPGENKDEQNVEQDLEFPGAPIQQHPANITSSYLSQEYRLDEPDFQPKEEEEPSRIEDLNFSQPNHISNDESFGSSIDLTSDTEQVDDAPSMLEGMQHNLINDSHSRSYDYRDFDSMIK